MKALSAHVRWVATYLVTILILHLNADTQTRIDLPDGEPVIAVNTLLAKSNLRLVATRSTVYSSKYESGTGWMKNRAHYSIAVERRIVDAELRTGESGPMKSYALLLDDGTVIVLSYNSTSDSFEPDPVTLPSPANPQTQLQQGNQPAYRKVLFDNTITVQLGNILFTNDLSGNPWRNDSAGISQVFVNDLNFDINGKLLAATTQGIFQRGAAQTSWTRLPGFDSTTSVITLFCTRNGQRIYAATTTATFSSTDGGNTFSADSGGLNHAAIVRFSDDASNNVYAVAPITDRSSMLFRRSAVAKTWTRFDAAFNAYTVSTLRVLDISGQPTLDLVTAAGCFTSTNQGDTWSNSTHGIVAEDIYALEFFNGGITLVSTATGIFRKQTEWTKVFPAAGYSGARPLVRADKSSSVVATQLAQSADKPNSQGDIYMSSDMGATWQLDTVGLGELPTTGQFLPSLFQLDRNAKKYMAVSGTQGTSLKVFSSPWSIDTNGLDLPSGQNGTQFAINLYADESNTMFLSGGVFTGFQFILRNIFFYKRSVGSSQWTLDTAGLNNCPITSIVGTKTSTYLGSSSVDGASSLFRRSGNAWQKIPSPLSAVSDVRSLALDSTNSLFAVIGPLINQNALNRGVYATSDNGASWDYAGLNGYSVRGLTATSDGMYATTSRGAFKLIRQPFKSAVARFDKHELDFGSVDLGTQRDTTVTLTNTGNDTLRLFFVRSNSQNFFVTPYNINIAPGASQQMTITFLPVQSGDLEARLQSVSNTLPDTIFILGFGKAADAQMILASKFIIFGMIDLGTRKDTVIQMGNSGTEDLIIKQAFSTSPFFSVAPDHFTVKPGQLVDLTLSFTPQNTASVNGVIRFISNTPPDSLRVLGVGSIVFVETEDEAAKIGLKVKPNPARLEECIVRLDLKHSGKVTLRVINESGQYCGEQFTADLDAGVFEIPFKELLNEQKNGVYFIKAKTPGGNATVKCVISD